MLKNEKLRDSNFELLRIIAIIMVIISHYNFFGDFGEFTISNITFNSILVKIFCIGCISNHIFILLTGYYMIKSKVKYQKIIALILEMLFYSLLIAIVFYGLNISNFNFKGLLKSIFPIFWGNWFLIYYILLYLLIPYLNLFIEKLEQKKFKNLIILLLFIYIIIPTFTDNAWGYTKHDYFILDYFIGAYIRLFPVKKFESNKYNIKMLFTSIILTILSVLSLTYLGKILEINKLVQGSSHFIVNNHSLLIFLIGFFLFLIFKEIKIKPNKTINYIANSVLGIYLIHVNHIITPWIWNKFWPNNKFFNTIWFIPHAITKIALVFISCLIIDKIRILLFGKIEKKLSDKIYHFIIKCYHSMTNIVKKIYIVNE